ncbi:MAG: cytochrome c biogenesis protein CcsA [Planctomycetes bacterium]|nr:cytochrome c biogenesis protein CcsA [Planctomycetota bacterium]
MLQLPLNEKLVFYAVLAVYMFAGGVAVRQLAPGGEKYKRLLTALIALGVSLQSVMLIFRAVSLKAFPLTGLFESMIFLGITFGLVYLFTSIVVSQIWFGSAMTWIMVLLVALSAKVASPVAGEYESATTPWGIAHGLSMIMGGATIAFSAASAWMYLLANKRLKQKQIGKVLGRMPNVSRLQKMNIFGIETCFVFVSFGLFVGLGLAAIQIQMGEKIWSQWLIDPRTVLIILAWLLLAVMLMLRFFARLGGRAIAYMTLVVFFLIIFATVGVVMFCGTIHD